MEQDFPLAEAEVGGGEPLPRGRGRRETEVDLFYTAIYNVQSLYRDFLRLFLNRILFLQDLSQEERQ